MRGLHLQLRRPQGKLIRVIEGEIYDVAVDVRRGSPTFARWVAVMLSADNFRQCYIPPGFAHGFSVASPLAQVEYKCTDLYDPADEIGIAWNDQSFGIHWPIHEPILSERNSPGGAALIPESKCEARRHGPGVDENDGSLPTASIDDLRKHLAGAGR